MDEYELEINQAQRLVTHLTESKSDPLLLHQYELELYNLRALYRKAAEVYSACDEQPELAPALLRLGYGDWEIGSVYGFVYETAMELDADAEQLAQLVGETDFVALLLQSLE